MQTFDHQNSMIFKNDELTVWSLSGIFGSKLDLVDIKNDLGGFYYTFYLDVYLKAIFF